MNRGLHSLSRERETDFGVFWRSYSKLNQRNQTTTALINFTAMETSVAAFAGKNVSLHNIQASAKLFTVKNHSISICTE